jgi:hypothetical protein
MSNLPRQVSLSANNDTAVRDFFDEYYKDRIEYAANEVDAVLGFFSKRGFDKAASSSLTATLLRQAKADNVGTFKLLDTLKGLSDIQLSALIAEVLNYTRIKSSSLGFRIRSTSNLLESRNIAP